MCDHFLGRFLCKNVVQRYQIRCNILIKLNVYIFYVYNKRSYYFGSQFTHNSLTFYSIDFSVIIVINTMV